MKYFNVIELAQMEVCHSVLGVKIASCPDGLNRWVSAIWSDYFLQLVSHSKRGLFQSESLSSVGQYSSGSS